MAVHNHGSEEGEGLECPELRLPDGSLKGRCLMKCRASKCREVHPNLNRAHEDGWFVSRNNVPWCPKHKPPWVDEWRAKKASLNTPVVTEAELLAQIELDAVEVLKEWAKRDFVVEGVWFEIVRVGSSISSTEWRGFFKIQDSTACFMETLVLEVRYNKKTEKLYYSAFQETGLNP